MNQNAELKAHDLKNYGWDDFFANAFQPFSQEGFEAGRVFLEHRGACRLYTARGERPAVNSGKLEHSAAGRRSLPAVGDWVVYRPLPGEERAVIHAVLPRRGFFSRRCAGRAAQEQIVGANIDTAFLVTSLNRDFNPRRMERYLAAAWDSGAHPVILLTKTDLCPEVAPCLSRMEEAAPGVPVHALCALRGEGLAAVTRYLETGQTTALLGSSGVGKSTLINTLAGEERLAVRAIRADDGRGRHATARRELVLLPGGGLILDTPGMRELQPWDAGDGVEAVFDDIEALARRCFFRNCRHGNEPRCAVRAALENGSLTRGRFESYEKLRREQRYLERQQDRNAQRIEQLRWKKLTRMASRLSEQKRRWE